MLELPAIRATLVMLRVCMIRVIVAAMFMDEGNL